jgi:pimeloyl-ACP methyl ester carboxylesterase/putative sterol carrier protein
MSKFLDQSWLDAYVDTLNADAEWMEAARYFPARIDFRDSSAVASIDVQDGKATLAGEGPAQRSHVVLVAPDREWERVRQGETDFFQGTSPGLGEISIEGDAVDAMRNVKVLVQSLLAMRRVGQKLPDKPNPSPVPRPSGLKTVGHYVEVDGLRTYYEESGEGYPLLCFHAACQDTLMFRHVLDGLSDEFKVIAVDAPSHGKTLEPKGGEFRSLTQHAEFNEHLIEALGLDRPVIVGCSMGGNLVLEMASRRPDGYAAVISSEGADFTPTMSQFLLDMLMLNGQQIVECYAKSLIGDRTPADRSREVVWQIRKVNPEVMVGDLTGYAGFDKRDAVGAITSPVLLLRGEDDWLVSQDHVEATSTRIPGSVISVLPGTGHYPMIENPFEFNEALRTFLHGLGIGVIGS